MHPTKRGIKRATIINTTIPIAANAHISILLLGPAMGFKNYKYNNK
jgi:hypothetical protein